MKAGRVTIDADRAFWRRHAYWPFALFATAFFVLELFSLDRVLADAWYFNVASRRWLGTGPGEWWAHGLLHTDGRWAVRCAAALALVFWTLSFTFARLRAWRRPAGFIFLAMLLSIGIVGALKAVTNVDCPWDLAAYGGHNPYVPLFADRPDALPRARCFPGAHASSGFALLCFYFAMRDRSRHRARWMLGGALLVGVAFSVGQEARGAHFISHDLTSAAIVWFVQLALYVCMLRPAAGAVARLRA